MLCEKVTHVGLHINAAGPAGGPVYVAGCGRCTVQGVCTSCARRHLVGWTSVVWSHGGCLSLGHVGVAGPALATQARPDAEALRCFGLVVVFRLGLRLGQIECGAEDAKRLPEPCALLGVVLVAVLVRVVE